MAEETELPPSPSALLHYDLYHAVGDPLQVHVPLTERDQKYYFDFAVFLIEDRLYMVPKYQFMKSTDFFTSKFQSTIDEEAPITLADVEKVDFQALLKLMYPLNPTYEKPTLSQEEWTSVLKLASLWMMLDLREMAIQHLQTLLSQGRKIILAREYGVYDWLRTGYIHFATREQSISLEDAMALGIDATLKLVSMREDDLQRNREEARRHGHVGALDKTFTSPVDNEFSAELQKAEAMDLVSQVVMARQYKVKDWLRQALIGLTERKELVSADEADKLTLATTMQLCRIRDACLRSYPSYRRADSGARERNVERVFKEELESVRLVNDRYLEPSGITPPPAPSRGPPAPTFQQPSNVSNGTAMVELDGSAGWGGKDVTRKFKALLDLMPTLNHISRHKLHAHRLRSGYIRVAFNTDIDAISFVTIWAAGPRPIRYDNVTAKMMED
ncbi:hypothetical protein LshimejAT787_0600890 [Lyophyllum shimeji]|uniref:BTB domain-containing protein n=1 Tax=Lyophyllum shimeji TaxID=47721 RepID=A0A9P3PPA1_LYOSH|nr:hypothetical protein LshimejAT787_0600890 [Lyophyllum shimeji]